VSDAWEGRGGGGNRDKTGMGVKGSACMQAAHGLAVLSGWRSERYRRGSRSPLMNQPPSLEIRARRIDRLSSVRHCTTCNCGMLPGLRGVEKPPHQGLLKARKADASMQTRMRRPHG